MKLRKITAVILTIALICCTHGVEAKASTAKTLKADDVCALAMARSTDYRNMTRQLSQKNAEYKSAVKAASIQGSSTDTFDFSMMATASVPDTSELSEDFSYTFKPVALKLEISALQHSLDTLGYETKSKTMLLYDSIYEKQERIKIEQEEMAEYEKRLEKAKAGVYAGLKVKDNVDDASKRVDDITSKIAQDTDDLIDNEKKLSDMIGMDVTSGYVFSSPFMGVDLSRQDADLLTDRALEYDNALYEAKLDAESKRLAMNTDYTLMYRQYGDIVAPMKTYIEQVTDGDTPDTAAMKETNDEMTEAIKAQYSGTVRVLSVKISKEFMKGSASGIEYIKDDPDVLINAINDYMDAKGEISQAEADVKSAVSDAYSAMAEKLRAYLIAESTLNRAKDKYVRGNDMKKTGVISEEDFEALEDAKNEATDNEIKCSMDMMKSVREFDRITAGGIEYLQEMKAEDDGVTSDEADGATYYFKSLVADDSFEFGIYIPGSFAADVTDYELWAGDEQIGERTKVTDSIVHMNLTTGNTDNVFVRLYDGDDFVDDCKVDPDKAGGSLTVNYNYTVSGNQGVSIGTFTYRNNGASHLTTISLKVNSNEKARSYELLDENGKSLLSGKRTDVTESFSYLNVAAGSIDRLQVVFYDKLDREMYRAHLKTENMSIVKDAGK